MKIEILCTGDEILTGKTTNTNYSFIAQRLTENSLEVVHGTSIGDDKDALKQAFLQAAGRADAVIVNGGLGPTVDDLSQEVAAATADVELVCNTEWLDKLKGYFEIRGRKMPENNTRQAMLPAGSELLDNPIGTACGFALDINGTRFFFTPGVPREMKRMITEQVLPRLLSMSGIKTVSRLKRFHTFGIGESRADQLLTNIIPSESERAIKLGFQTHYPQLETKLMIQADSEAQIDHMLEPVVAELRTRLGNAILCEDDQTVETVILDSLQNTKSTLSCMEMATGGVIASRLMTALKGRKLLHQCLTSPTLDQLCRAVNSTTDSSARSAELAVILAEMQTRSTGSSHSLVVLTDEVRTLEKAELIISIGIHGPNGPSQRSAILPGKATWTRLGATELALDCLRRYLIGLPASEKIDFEKDQTQ